MFVGGGLWSLPGLLLRNTGRGTLRLSVAGVPFASTPLRIHSKVTGCLDSSLSCVQVDVGILYDTLSAQ